MADKVRVAEAEAAAQADAAKASEENLTELKVQVKAMSSQAASRQASRSLSSPFPPETDTQHQATDLSELAANAAKRRQALGVEIKEPYPVASSGMPTDRSAAKSNPDISLFSVPEPRNHQKEVAGEMVIKSIDDTQPQLNLTFSLYTTRNAQEEVADEMATEAIDDAMAEVKMEDDTRMRAQLKDRLQNNDSELNSDVRSLEVQLSVFPATMGDSGGSAGVAVAAANKQHASSVDASQMNPAFCNSLARSVVHDLEALKQQHRMLAIAAVAALQRVLEASSALAAHQSSLRAADADHQTASLKASAALVSMAKAQVDSEQQRNALLMKELINLRNRIEETKPLPANQEAAPKKDAPRRDGGGRDYYIPTEADNDEFAIMRANLRASRFEVYDLSQHLLTARQRVSELAQELLEVSNDAAVFESTVLRFEALTALILQRGAAPLKLVPG
eukprot:gene29669-5084_t